MTSEILFCQASCKEKQNTKMAEDPKSAIEDTPSNDYRNRLGSEVAIGIDDLSAIPKGTIDPVYEAKARVLNRAIQDIGMGWYQWQLFIVVGFGWASDVSMLFFLASWKAVCHSSPRPSAVFLFYIIKVCLTPTCRISGPSSRLLSSRPSPTNSARPGRRY